MSTRLQGGGLAAALALACLAGTAEKACALGVDANYSLTLTNFANAGAPPYGSVNVHIDTSTTATITLTSSTIGVTSGQYNLFGAVNAFDFNFVSATTINSTTGTRLGSANGSFSNGGSGNVDGWGVFTTTLNNTDGFNDAVDVLVVKVTKNSGTWANGADVLQANAGGHTVAAHLFVATASTTGGVTTLTNPGDGFTGFVTDGAVPEPSTLLLLGGCVAGMAGFRLRRRRAIA